MHSPKPQSMRILGVLLLVMGAGSFLLHQFDMEFRLLQWVDQWGAQTGNYIRIGAAVLGIILIFASARRRRTA
jgi:hypothetical protein